jgi:phosphatidylserine/phosphatidylglycerophosphate/cardiolipin synthase-like enzyme
LFKAFVSAKCNILYNKIFYTDNIQSPYDYLIRSYPKTDSKKTRILYGVQNTANTILRLISKSKDTIDICGDYIVLSETIRSEVLKKALRDAKGRGVALRTYPKSPAAL